MKVNAMRIVQILLGLATAITLTACGVDGEPETPSQANGISITGQVEVGIAGSN